MKTTPTLSKWDERFLRMAKEAASWSKDPSTQTGAVLVDGDGNIVSTGFNGFPRKMPDVQANYDNREEKYSRIVHCEMNALISAKRDVTGCTLYTYPFISCDRCMVHMIQAGVVRYVAPAPTANQLERWGTAFEKTKRYAAECGVVVEEVAFD